MPSSYCWSARFAIRGSWRPVDTWQQIITHLAPHMHQWQNEQVTACTVRHADDHGMIPTGRYVHTHTRNIGTQNLAGNMCTLGPGCTTGTQNKSRYNMTRPPQCCASMGLSQPKCRGTAALRARANPSHSQLQHQLAAGAVNSCFACETVCKMGY